MIDRQLLEFSGDSQSSNLNFFFLYWRRRSRLREKELLSRGGKGDNAHMMTKMRMRMMWEEPSTTPP